MYCWFVSSVVRSTLAATAAQRLLSSNPPPRGRTLPTLRSGQPSVEDAAAGRQVPSVRSPPHHLPAEKVTWATTPVSVVAVRAPQIGSSQCFLAGESRPGSPRRPKRALARDPPQR